MLQLRLVDTKKNFALVFLYSKFTTFKVTKYYALFTMTSFKNFSHIHIHDSYCSVKKNESNKDTGYE